MPIEICGCYHDKEIWTPCDEHKESIVKKAVLTGSDWWMGTSSDDGDWTGLFKTRFPVHGPRQANTTNPLLEHGIDKNEFWFLDEDSLHKAVHTPPHLHDKIDYEFNDEENNNLSILKQQLDNGEIEPYKAGESVGLLIAQAQARKVPDWSAGIHLVLKHGLPPTGLPVDGHIHTQNVPDDRLEEHMNLAHNDTRGDNVNIRHNMYHKGYSHFVHNKLNSLYTPDHSHGIM